jgi:hypothetical protein
MKPGKTFNLSKRNKTMSALFKFTDTGQRNAFKKMMIQAQLAGDVKVAREKSDQK